MLNSLEREQLWLMSDPDTRTEIGERGANGLNNNTMLYPVLLTLKQIHPKLLIFNLGCSTRGRTSQSHRLNNVGTRGDRKGLPCGGPCPCTDQTFRCCPHKVVFATL